VTRDEGWGNSGHDDEAWDARSFSGGRFRVGGRGGVAWIYCLRCLGMVIKGSTALATMGRKI